MSNLDATQNQKDLLKLAEEFKAVKRSVKEASDKFNAGKPVSKTEIDKILMDLLEYSTMGKSINRLAPPGFKKKSREFFERIDATIKLIREETEDEKTVMFSKGFYQKRVS